MIRLTLLITNLLITFQAIAATLPPATSQHAMVVTAQRDATKVGVKVLQQGGNAVDAAVAIGYALAVVHPCCGNIGGGGFMLIRFPNGKTTFINFREKAPLGLTAKMYVDKKGELKQTLSRGHEGGSGKIAKPYLAVGIPGTVMGLNTVLTQYGSQPLSTLMQPAIHFAENGFRISPFGARILAYGAESFQDDPVIAKIFLTNGQPPKPGDIVVQKNLANTLKKIAKDGTKAFYNGDIALDIVKHAQASGSVISKQDFEQYTIGEMQPIRCNYRGYDIITSPPPSSGGVTVCEVLNIVNGFSLKEMGFHSAAATHVNVEAMRYAYADRNAHLGDPDFVDNPTAKLISPVYAAEIRKKISPNKATDSRTIGFTAPQLEGNNTTAYVVVDKNGMAVSVTYTINHYFGARIMAGDTGFFLNNELDDFTLKLGVPNAFGLIQGKANIIAPGKRPLSSIAPTIITKNGILFMVIGTPGGSTIPSQLIQVIENVIDFDMNIQQAVNAPRYHMQWLPDNIFMEPFTFSADTQNVLNKLGHKLKPGSPYGTTRWGAVTAIQVDAKTGELQGAMDARRPAGLAKGF